MLKFPSCPGLRGQEQYVRCVQLLGRPVLLHEVGQSLTGGRGGLGRYADRNRGGGALRQIRQDVNLRRLLGEASDERHVIVPFRSANYAQYLILAVGVQAIYQAPLRQLAGVVDDSAVLDVELPGFATPQRSQPYGSYYLFYVQLPALGGLYARTAGAIALQDGRVAGIALYRQFTGVQR